jgi:hypothetical protein
MHVSDLNLHNNNLALQELVEYNVGENGMPDGRDSSFEFVSKKFAEIENTKGSYAWFINLINPKTYFGNKIWTDNYTEKILRLSMEKGCVDIRRIHVFLKKDYELHENEENINTTLFTEQLFGIDNRVMYLDDDNDQAESNPINIFLLDYCIFYSQKESNENYFDARKKIVLCSDVIPYFYKKSKSQRDNDVKVYALIDHNSFNIFKENFLTLWHFTQYMEREKEIKKSYFIYDFFDLIKGDQIKSSNIKWEKIAKFLAKCNNISTKEKEKEIEDDLDLIFRKFIKDKSNITRENFNTQFEKHLIHNVSNIPYLN